MNIGRIKCSINVVLPAVRCFTENGWAKANQFRRYVIGVIYPTPRFVTSGMISQSIYAESAKEIWVHDKTSTRLVKYILSSGATVEKHYDQDGELLTEIDPSGNKTEYHKAENYRYHRYIYTPDGHGFNPLTQLNGRK